MKVDRNYRSYRNFGAQNTAQQRPNFTAKLPRLAQEMKDHLPDKGKKMINILDKFEPLRGEAGGIIITALGTGIVAPIFIAFNPFSKAPKGATKEEKKEHENTKVYTAWRQPISAVLAALFQLSVLKYIDRGLNSLFNKPENAKNMWIELNQSRMNNDKYLERIAEKEIKNEKLKFNNKDELKEEIARRVDAKKSAQLEDVTNELMRTGRIKMGENVYLPDKTVASALNEQIDKYIEDARNVKISEKGLEYYSKRGELLMNNRFELTQILNAAPDDAKKLEKYLKETIEKTNNKEVKDLLQEILDKSPANLRKSKCVRTIARIRKIDEACIGGYSKDNYLNSMIKDNGELDQLIQKLRQAKINDIDHASPEGIKNAISQVQHHCLLDDKNSRLYQLLSNTENFKGDRTVLLKKINKDVAKGIRSSVASRYKCINQLAKIVIGMFITVPVTCTALNWTYPRFMDIFFPNLSGKKKAQVKNGGEK